MKKLVFTHGKYVFKAQRILKHFDTSVEKLSLKEEQQLPNGIAPCGNVLLLKEEDLQNALMILEKHRIEIYAILS